MYDALEYSFSKKKDRFQDGFVYVFDESSLKNNVYRTICLPTFSSLSSLKTEELLNQMLYVRSLIISYKWQHTLHRNLFL